MCISSACVNSLPDAEEKLAGSKSALDLQVKYKTKGDFTHFKIETIYYSLDG